MLDIEIPNFETHLNIALSLYLQRVNCLEQLVVKFSVQQAIEKRLLIHLYVLSNLIDPNEAQPKDDAELFVYMSTCLLAKNKDFREDAISFARKIFIEYPEPKGLIDSFVLFYDSDIKALLSELFESYKKLRASILTIWRICGEEIPLGLLNQSELQSNDDLLQETVLLYQAEQKNIGLELFQNYYRSLVDNIEKEVISSTVIHAALWGGMIKQDPNISKAVRRAIEVEFDKSHRGKYFRLAALMGNVDFLPVFISVAESNIELGSYLISLLGSGESVKVLFSMLKNPQTSIAAIPAWEVITGQKLKTVPRLSLVDNATAANDNDDVPDMADLQSAQKYAKTIVSEWDNGSRYIYGMPLNKNNLIELSYQISGKMGVDLYDLLSLELRESSNIKIERWISDKKLILDELA
ncbi:hypothetical protein MNBD_GAMMA22-536 [hydrothermal vent metagenome]|uniref:Uncharacterized protein n=1 Tax=hydrothermal vent metagenome TaxID=652676 RepID=A0A3B0ZMN2_9ZZZZ